MGRIFDIRFAQTTGLAALFEAPANSFRWKGSGRLSIDDQWLVFVRDRVLTWPFARLRHRIPATALSSVYREGDSLRLEFAGPPVLVVPIWARDRAEAAEIVRLVPTDRTVEVDTAKPRPPSSSGRRHGGLVALACAAVIGAVAGSLIVGNREGTEIAAARPAATLDRAMPTTVSPPSPEQPSADTTTARIDTFDSRFAPPTSLPDDTSTELDDPTSHDARTAVPAGAIRTEAPDSTPGSAVVNGPAVALTPAPRSDFFRPEALALISDYVYGRTAGLEDQWWNLSVRLYNSPEFEDLRTRPMVDAQLGVSLNWRASLASYDAAVRSGDPARIAAARLELEQANELTDRVLGFSY